MTNAVILILVLGALPVVVTLLSKTLAGLHVIPTIKPHQTQLPSLGWYHLPNEASLISIGESTICPIASAADTIISTSRLRFTTLHLRHNKTSKATWRLGIEFEIFNEGAHQEVILDDIHVRLFERNAYAPPLLTISFFGDVWLMQDNRMFKDKNTYSIGNGDGFVLNLHLEATRIEGAPEYGDHGHESEGRLTVVFGILVDYYHHLTTGIQRCVLVSDCLYVFQADSVSGDALFLTLNQSDIEQRISDATENETISFLQRVRDYYQDHNSFRPTRVM